MFTANATVKFGNASHITKKKIYLMSVLTLRWHLIMQITQQKNGLPAQYLVLKDLDPKLLLDTHLFAKESFIITESTISLQNKTLDTKLKTILSLDMTYWQTCTFMHNFNSHHSKLINSWALQLPAFLLSSWVINGTKERSGCTCMCQQKKKKERKLTTC
jgi:hypothetical protein